MSKLKVLAFSILLVLILAEATGCEPTAPFSIKNDTSEILYVVIAVTDTDYISGKGLKPLGEVKPSEIFRPKHILGIFNTYLVEARDVQGNVVYSKLFSNQELRDMH
jgi:hypothetical protein